MGLDSFNETDLGNPGLFPPQRNTVAEEDGRLLGEVGTDPGGFLQSGELIRHKERPLGGREHGTQELEIEADFRDA